MVVSGEKKWTYFLVIGTFFEITRYSLWNLLPFIHHLERPLQPRHDW